MKKILIMLVVPLVFLFAEDSVSKYKIDGLRCSVSCCNKVKTALQDTKGIKNADVDFENKVATVTFDKNEIDDQKIVEVLSSKTAYTYTQILPEATIEKKSFFKRLFNIGS